MTTDRTRSIFKTTLGLPFFTIGKTASQPATKAGTTDPKGAGRTGRGLVDRGETSRHTMSREAATHTGESRPQRRADLRPPNLVLAGTATLLLLLLACTAVEAAPQRDAPPGQHRPQHGEGQHHRHGALSRDDAVAVMPVSYTHLRAHETRHDLVCRLL